MEAEDSTNLHSRHAVQQRERIKNIDAEQHGNFLQSIKMKRIKPPTKTI